MGLAEAEGIVAGAVLTTRTRTMEPPAARARRAAIGSARSARMEPSSGTRIRLNMHMLLLFKISLERSCGYVYNVQGTERDRVASPNPVTVQDTITQLPPPRMRA